MDGYREIDDMGQKTATGAKNVWNRYCCVVLDRCDVYLIFHNYEGLVDSVFEEKRYAAV